MPQHREGTPDDLRGARRVLERACDGLLDPHTEAYRYLMQLAETERPDLTQRTASELRNIAAACIWLGAFLARAHNRMSEAAARNHLLAIGLLTSEYNRLRIRATHLEGRVRKTVSGPTAPKTFGGGVLPD